MIIIYSIYPHLNCVDGLFRYYFPTYFALFSNKIGSVIGLNPLEHRYIGAYCSHRGVVGADEVRRRYQNYCIYWYRKRPR